jgi:hypothetical protein
MPAHHPTDAIAVAAAIHTPEAPATDFGPSAPATAPAPNCARDLRHSHPFGSADTDLPSGVPTPSERCASSSMRHALGEVRSKPIGRSRGLEQPRVPATRSGASVATVRFLDRSYVPLCPFPATPRSGLQPYCQGYDWQLLENFYVFRYGSADAAICCINDTDADLGPRRSAAPHACGLRLNKLE